MNVEQQVRTVLTTDAGVLAVIGATPPLRVYPQLLPQDCTMPAVRFQRVSTVPQNGLDGHHSLDQVRVQVDSWASDYDDAKTLAAAVRAAMALAPLYALCVMELDDYDPDQSLHRVVQDFSIWN